MKHAGYIVFMLTPFLFAGECPRQPKTPAALAQVEQTWAHGLETKDAAALGCILADEFEDDSANGAVYKRADVLANLPQRKPRHNALSDLQPHLLGEDFAYVRGLNTVTDPDGTVVAHVRFTDIFAYREGRWMAIAGHESLVQEK